MKWRPIETAPRDGTPILVFSPYHDLGEPTNVIVAQYGGVENNEPWWLPLENLIADVQGMVEPPPTHWMPLPEPPTESVK